jgi:hypothetical protein
MRRVFFSFHYERDAWRAAIVRNSDVTKQSVEEAGFIDNASWESIKKEGETAIKRWIGRQLEGTSVTVVLIGRETYTRDWVDYEIEESLKKGNGLLGIYIGKILDVDRKTDTRGENPLSKWNLGNVNVATIYHTYDWEIDNGYNNFGKWVEEAAKKAGK